MGELDVSVDEEHQISVRVEGDLLRDGQFRWALMRSGRPEVRSSVCYSSRQDAEAAASKALKAHVAQWTYAKRGWAGRCC
jgi:hypothetical protein